MPAVAVAFIAGAALVFGLAVLPSPLTLVTVACAGALALFAGHRAAAGLVAGFVLASAQGHLALADDWPCQRDREQVELLGMVNAPAEVRPGRVDFDLKTSPATRAQGLPALVHLSWYEPTTTPRPGETLRLTARLRCRSGLANPGGYDRELDLLRRGYGATGYLTGPVEPALPSSSVFRSPVAAARAWIAARIADSAGHTRSAGVLQGLAVGLRGNIPPELTDAFVATGTAHLIAISGMHVTAFALTVLLLSRRLYGVVAVARVSARWPSWQALLVLVVTSAYGLLAGASLPTVRTVAMVGVAVSLRLARRHASAADLLSVAAIGLVAADPLAVTSAGFWLSFGAVAALLGLTEPRQGFAAPLRSFARSQAAVTVVLTPVLVGAFGAVPVFGPAVNALAIPLFSFCILPATLAGTALLPFAPNLADRVWSSLGAALDHCWPLLIRVGEGAWATLSPPAAPSWLLACSLVAALAAVIVPGRGLKCVAAVLLGAVLLRPTVAPARGAFELTVLDVGHGLATVVRTASHVLVFDTGPRWRGGGAAARVTVVPNLRSLGIRHIDMVVVSHDDSDHSGGLDVLRRSFVVSSVRGRPDPREGEADGRCVAGDSWHWDGVKFALKHPPSDGSFHGNDGSCALHVEGRGGAALLLADPEARAEAAMLTQALAAEIVLVPHHGSRSSSSPGLVAAVGARLALVSAGYGNRWSLPRAEVVQRWHDAGAAVLTTAEGGAISVLVEPDAGISPPRAWRLERKRWWHRQ